MCFYLSIYERGPVCADCIRHAACGHGMDEWLMRQRSEPDCFIFFIVIWSVGRNERGIFKSHIECSWVQVEANQIFVVDVLGAEQITWAISFFEFTSCLLRMFDRMLPSRIVNFTKVGNNNNAEIFHHNVCTIFFFSNLCRSAGSLLVTLRFRQQRRTKISGRLPNAATISGDMMMERMRIQRCRSFSLVFVRAKGA